MKVFLFVLAVAGFADAISWMIVTPSLIFYVIELGGVKEAYGFTLSAFSLSAFIAKPVLGRLSDERGFRLPYIISFSVATVGGLLYFLTSAAPANWAISVLILSRLLGGVGGGSSSLGYAYMARAIPLEDQTGTNAILSLIRILGMSLGPFLNAFLAGLDGQFKLFGVKVTSSNSVGLLVMLLNVVAGLLIFLVLENLPVRQERRVSTTKLELRSVKDDRWAVTKAFFTAEILVPFFVTFCYNANFQLIETAFAPAAHHALQWGTIQTSTVLGSISVVIAFCMLLVYVLSKTCRVMDEVLMGSGLVFSGIAYTCLYYLWKDDAAPWHFWFPVVLSGAAYPFLSAPTISVFSKQVEHNPVLKPHHGTMQAILGMSASVAGFVAPSVVAAFVLRHPDQVDASKDHRELTRLALLAPAISFLSLLGLLYVQCVRRPFEGKTKDNEQRANETTELDVRLNDASERRLSITEDSMPRLRFFQIGHNLMDDISQGSRQSAAITMLEIDA